MGGDLLGWLGRSLHGSRRNLRWASLLLALLHCPVEVVRGGIQVAGRRGEIAVAKKSEAYVVGCPAAHGAKSAALFIDARETMNGRMRDKPCCVVVTGPGDEIGAGHFDAKS